MKPIKRLLFLLSFLPMIPFQFIMFILWIPLTIVFLFASVVRYIAVGKFFQYVDFFVGVILWPTLAHLSLTDNDFFRPILYEYENTDSDDEYLEDEYEEYDEYDE